MPAKFMQQESNGASATALPWLSVLPVLAALYYPWALIAAHQSYTSATPSLAFLLYLIAAYAVPVFGLICAWRVGCGQQDPSDARRAIARKMGCAAVAAPPAYTLMGVVLYLIKVNGAEMAVWTALCLSVALYGSLMLMVHGASGTQPLSVSPSPVVRLTVAHGVSAVLLLAVFIVPHLSNHALGIFGFDVHRRLMHVLRLVYRNPLVQPVLLVLFLFQAISGLVLLRSKMAQRSDFWLTLQIASAAYLLIFIPTHINSVFTLARYFGTETDYAWAVGAPTGLLADAWDIRLLPHYSLAVFLLIAHCACAMRSLFIKHGMPVPRANVFGHVTLGGALLATLIITSGMLGYRLPW